MIPADSRDRLPRSQRPCHGRRSEWCASQATRHIALVRSVDVDKPGHDTMAFTALPRYSSAMIAPSHDQLKLGAISVEHLECKANGRYVPL
jgi:hypothetical protein